MRAFFFNWVVITSSMTMCAMRPEIPPAKFPVCYTHVRWHFITDLGVCSIDLISPSIGAR